MSTDVSRKPHEQLNVKFLNSAAGVDQRSARTDEVGHGVYCGLTSSAPFGLRAAGRSGMTGGDPVVVPPADPEPDTAAPVGPPPNTEPLDDGGPYRGFASAAEVSGLPMTESPADDPRNRRVVLTITCT